MGNNVKYLARQLSKLCAQQKMKSELTAFVKERCSYYTPLATDLCEKDKAGTLTDEEFKRLDETKFILESYLEYSISLVDEIQKLMKERDKVVEKVEKFLKTQGVER